MTRRLVIALLLVTRLAHADDDTLYACKEVPPTTKLSATFKPEIEIKDLVTWVMGFQCRNIVIAPDVIRNTGRLTIVAPAKMTPKQALQLFVDALESAGLTVVVKPDTIIIKLGPNMPKGCPVAQAPSPGGTPTAPAEWDNDPLVKKLEAGLTGSGNDYQLTLAALNLLLDEPGLHAGVRIVPAMKDGKPDGIKLYAIRPSSPAALLGFTNGDTVRSVAGLAVTGDDDLRRLPGKIRSTLFAAKGPVKIAVDVVRRGAPVTLTYTVK